MLGGRGLSVGSWKGRACKGLKELVPVRLVLREQFISTRWKRGGMWPAAGTKCLENRACLEDTQGHWSSAQCALKAHLAKVGNGYPGAEINYKGSIVPNSVNMGFARERAPKWSCSGRDQYRKGTTMPLGKGTTGKHWLPKIQSQPWSIMIRRQLEDTVLSQPAHTSAEKVELANTRPSAEARTCNVHFGSRLAPFT